MAADEIEQRTICSIFSATGFPAFLNILSKKERKIITQPSPVNKKSPKH
jgi:hypothetical protein